MQRTEKTTMSFRIPIDLEKALHKYCAGQDDRISKSELITQLINEFLKQKLKGEISSVEKPKATEDIYN